MLHFECGVLVALGAWCRCLSVELGGLEDCVGVGAGSRSSFLGKEPPPHLGTIGGNTELCCCATNPS